MWYSPKEDDLEILQISVTLADYDNWFAVQLKENEDSNAFFRKKKIVKLQDDLKKEKKNLKRHQDAIAQAESNIEIFKKKGLAQDLIDEENASILSNQESVQKYQKVIEKLESEIEKIKET